MKTYLKIAISYLKKQKIRSSILISGVALAIMLVFGFNVISESQSKNQLNAIYDLYGSYHATFSNLDKNDIDKLNNDKSVIKLETVVNLGDVIYENGIKMQLESSNEEYIRAHKYELKDGKLPSNKNEIVLEEKALEEMNLEKKLNQTINLKVKKEYKDENGINQIFIEDHPFKLVGILEKPNQYYTDFYYLKAFTFFKEGENNIIPTELTSYTGALSLKTGIKNIDKNLNTIRTKNNIGRLDFEPNINLTTALNDYNASKNNESQKDVKLLVIITAILLIYNLFNISLTEMINQIGTLRTIGASKKHVRLILTIQSIIIFVAGVIFGILGGIVFSYLGIKIFTFTGTNIDTSTAQVYVNVKNIFDAIKVGFITVVVSSAIPIYMAGKVSPLEALRKSDKSNISQKERLHHKAIRKIFGISGEMAYKNIWRNKLRTCISILSISIGGILFIFTIAVAKSDSSDKMNMSIVSMGDSSFKLLCGANSDTNLSGYTDEDIQKILNINGVKSVKTKKEIGGFIEVESNNLYEEYKKYNGITEDGNQMEIPMSIKMYDDKQLSGFEEFINKGKLSSINKSTDQYPNVIVFNNYYDILEDHRTEEVIEELNIGDLITIKVPTSKDGTLKYENHKVRVSAMLDTRWVFEGDSTRGRYPEIIMSQNDMENIIGKSTYSQVSLVTEDGSDNNVDKELNSILKDRPWSSRESKLQYKNEYKEYQKNHVGSKMIIFTLILFISILNIFCSMRTSLLLRTNEFSTLRAIGMSINQVKSMILKESIIYGFLSSIIAAILGSYKHYSLVERTNRDYAYAFNMSTIEVFRIPIAEILIFSVISIAICILSAYFSNKKIEKLNIIEGLKTTE